MDFKKTIGWKVFLEIRVLDTYQRIVKANYFDLIEQIQVFEERWSKISEIGEKELESNREKYDFINIDLVRVLHNYLMSSKSLRDKCTGLRNHINRKIENKSIPEKDYETKIKQLNLKQLDKLITILRNDFTHRTGSEGIYQYGLTITWNITDHRFIDARIVLSDQDIKLGELLSKHYEAVSKFMKWYKSVILEIFSSEINEMKADAEVKRIFSQEFFDNIL